MCNLIPEPLDSDEAFPHWRFHSGCAMGAASLEAVMCVCGNPMIECVGVLCRKVVLFSYHIVDSGRIQTEGMRKCVTRNRENWRRISHCF